MIESKDWIYRYSWFMARESNYDKGLLFTNDTSKSVLNTLGQTYNTFSLSPTDAPTLNPTETTSNPTSNPSSNPTNNPSSSNPSSPPSVIVDENMSNDIYPKIMTTIFVT